MIASDFSPRWPGQIQGSRGATTCDMPEVLPAISTEGTAALSRGRESSECEVI